MATTAAIVRLETEQFRAARAALAAAFFDYEVMVYAAPDAGRRAAAVYGAFVRDALRFGEVFAAGDGPADRVRAANGIAEADRVGIADGTGATNGVACWLPPRRTTITLVRQARAGMWELPWRFGVRGFSRLLAYDAIAARLHHAYAAGPHWYLSALGVEPQRQGQGLGGALMQPILARADAQGLPCYLETHRPGNVQLYQRHGFQICCHTEEPGHPVLVWAMLRPPRPAAT